MIISFAELARATEGHRVTAVVGDANCAFEITTALPLTSIDAMAFGPRSGMTT
jgi:hypothetical protein